MWDVITWDNEQAIDFVPSSWGNGDKSLYKYPTFISETKIRQYIYECRDLDDNYRWCKATVKRDNISTIEKAKQICKKGQFTSDIDSSTGPEEVINVNTKRKRTLSKRWINTTTEKKKFDKNSEEEEEGDDTSSEDEPLIKRTKLEKTVFKIPSSVPPKPPPKIIILNNQKITPTDAKPDEDNIPGPFSSSCKGSISREPNNIFNSSESMIAPSVDDRKTAQFTVHVNKNDANNDPDIRVYENLPANSSFGSSDSTLTNYSDDQNFPKDFMMEVLKNLAWIKFEIKQIKKQVDQIENKLNLHTTHQNLPEESIFISSLPCESMEHLNRIEDIITSKKEKLHELINILYLSGSDTVHKTVYGILKKLMVNQVALNYSGQGKKNKLPFCKLTLNQAVIYATRKRHQDVSDDEIKKNIGLYLAQTKARINASAINKKQAPETDDS